jgi:hypothetical protein
MAACGGGKSGVVASAPPGNAAPATTRIEINADHKRTTPLTTGEHADTATVAQAKGCHVMMTADQHIESMKCRLDGANYIISFDMPGNEQLQKIYCEAAEADVAKCEQVAFDKILDPKP